MKLRHTLRILFVCVCLAPDAQALVRGGETGTLDQEPGFKTATGLNESTGLAGQALLPYYLPQDHFRRLRARLGQQPLAPIPGWDARRALRLDDRYFTEDGAYELLPILNETAL